MNKNYNQLISKYIDNELSSDEKKSFEDYMKSNDDFANKVNKIKNNILFFKNISKFETSKDFIQNLNEQISKKQSNLFSFLPDFKTSLSFAFSLALLFFIIANISFELGTVFCNSYLPDISNNISVGTISGFSWGLGFFGGLLAFLTAFFILLLNISKSLILLGTALL